MITQTLDSKSISKIIESLQEAQQMLSVIRETNRETNNLLENTILTSSSENSMDDEELTTMNVVDDISFQSSQEDTNENIFSPHQPEDLSKVVVNDNTTSETDKNLFDTSNTTKKIAIKKWRLSPKKWRRMSRNRRLRSILLC
mmetsp:Transcript_7938/g.12160  ORF Transcript_7938/g.12160 Transcript_7938/m.12160 type:complete len:143 (+) Transcript_7938:54-482(+)